MHIVQDGIVQGFLKECTIPKKAEEVTIAPDSVLPFEPPVQNPIQHIIAIDGGYEEIVVRPEFPSAQICFFQFGALVLSRSDLESLDAQPFIDPADMSKLKEIHAQLKEHGIYVYLDQLVHRKFTPGDGVDLTDRGATFLSGALLVTAQLGDGFYLIYEINQVSLRQSVADERLQGRVNATFEFAGIGASLVGALLGGLLGQWVGVRPVLFAAAIGTILAALLIALSPLRRLKSTAQATPAE